MQEALGQAPEVVVLCVSSVLRVFPSNRLLCCCGMRGGKAAAQKKGQEKRAQLGAAQQEPGRGALSPARSVVWTRLSGLQRSDRVSSALCLTQFSFEAVVSITCVKSAVVD